MIITRTPFRVSFCGGGSDLPAYYERFGGSVLSVSINKYVYLSMHPYFNKDLCFLKYSKSELVEQVSDIKHQIIREVFQMYGIHGIDFNSSADIPSGTGLGSSSAFTVGLINLCNANLNRYLSQEDMAAEACDVEINRLGEPIGKQDQYASAVGGLNEIKFHEDGTVKVEKICLSKERLQELEGNLHMFYLGGARSASGILKEQKENMNSTKAYVLNLQKMVAMVDELKQEIFSGEIDAMGDILHRGWMYKKELASQISNPIIDEIYKKSLKAGAMGGKLLGAGGNGFILLYCKPCEFPAVKQALVDLHYLPFKFENGGSCVIYYD